jgi:hypothetical protein
MKDILDALVGKGSYDGGGIIIGSVIYDDIFKILITLGQYGGDGLLQQGTAIIGAGDDTNVWHN